MVQKDILIFVSRREQKISLSSKQKYMLHYTVEELEGLRQVLNLRVGFCTSFHQGALKTY